MFMMYGREHHHGPGEACCAKAHVADECYKNHRKFVATITSFPYDLGGNTFALGA